MRKPFTTRLCLPAQAAAETEATILKWHMAEGASFVKGDKLADVESAKSTFDFEAPCSGTVRRLLAAQDAVIPIESPVIEIETDDESMARQSAQAASVKGGDERNMPPMEAHPHNVEPATRVAVSLLGIGGYCPRRVVPNSELLKDFPDMTEEYLFGVTGIRQRYWAAPDEKPSDMALAAARDAIAASGLAPADIGGIVLATTTPDVVMPSTACILQHKLGIYGVPAMDINAACSGWLYGISVAKGLVLSGIADNILVVGVDMQSHLLDKKDKGTYFLFGDGAGATVVSKSRRGHVIKEEILIADAKGLQMARRDFPGYLTAGDSTDADPWVRLDGHALFRWAAGSFAQIIKETIVKSGWQPSDVRWVVPHQANGRIIKAAASRSGIPLERFYLNIDHMGNTSSASIPLALKEFHKGLQPGDRVIFCSVGAGITAAAMSIEW